MGMNDDYCDFGLTGSITTVNPSGC
ncbi:uncharacterized protein G2W53_013074 [Senna tora]|uniref:Uncharacterized protein n=1 Tax=Senna tora TaxID=362788 RepID=A0A834U1S2_9FABA|nr:uncharacterized protein G2W53_013074 [Senna tora]